MSNSTSTEPVVRAVPAGTGEHHHFLDHLATVKVRSSDLSSGTNVVEFTAPRGFGPPLHAHAEEDEIMIVSDGDIRLRSGDVESLVSAGDVAVLPVGIPHTFQVESDSARFTTISSGRDTQPSFDTFVSTLGRPIDDPTTIEAEGIDPAHVSTVCAAHGIEVLGPPPGPLA
ncbi:MAG: cupin domain-containing protein [Ilumatobacteraceae bacterium]|nr:cupin domain-containing protein [Ilumatobacteraceae bacterium]